MHLLGCAEYCIDRAGLNAECAANAKILIDDGNGARFGYSVPGVQRFGVYSQQPGDVADTIVVTRWALIDIRAFFHDCPGIGFATGEAALTALCLRQDGVNLFDQ